MVTGLVCITIYVLHLANKDVEHLYVAHPNLNGLPVLFLFRPRKYR